MACIKTSRLNDASHAMCELKGRVGVGKWANLVSLRCVIADLPMKHFFSFLSFSTSGALPPTEIFFFFWFGIHKLSRQFIRNAHKCRRNKKVIWKRADL